MLRAQAVGRAIDLLRLFREIRSMFNVSDTLPGFRVGTANDVPGLRIQDFDLPSDSYQTLSPMALLAGNPYLRIASYGRGIGSGGADVDPASSFGSPALGGRLQGPFEGDTAEELCRNVGRAGPYCLYQCPSGEWRARPVFPYGECLPFSVRGVGDFPWGGPASPK